MRDKKCRWTRCDKKAKKRISLTMKGINSGTIRVARFCSIAHFKLFKAEIVKQNSRIREREFEGKALRDKKI